MKHIAPVSVVRQRAVRGSAESPRVNEPLFADSKTDFLNDVWRDWWDYVYAKKNEIGGI